MIEIHDSEDFPAAWLATPQSTTDMVGAIERQLLAIAKRRAKGTAA